MVNIGINGFGRIGKLAMRRLLQKPDLGQVVAINNPGLSLDYMVYLLKYDSMHGRLDNVTVETDGNCLVVNGNKV